MVNIKELKSVIKRGDYFYTPNSFEIKNNDLQHWAIYSRIEDTVIRIHAYNKESSSIGYIFITTPDKLIPMNELQSNVVKIVNGIDMEENKEKIYKIIRRDI